MKTKYISLLFLIAPFHAQELELGRATLIPTPVPTTLATPAPQPPSLEITPDEILSSRTIVRPDQTITIQEITPQEVAPLPTPAPQQPLTPEAQAIRTARLAARGEHRVSMLSCTVHHNGTSESPRTHIRWTSQGKTPTESYEAWSNINFHHLTQVTAFKKAHVTHNILFGIGDKHSTHAAARAQRLGKPYNPPAIPTLPSDSATQPTYIVTQGTPAESDLAALDGLHELYQTNHTNFIAEAALIKQRNAQSAAELAANPPDPTPDLIIRYWNPQVTLAEKHQQAQPATPNEQGGAK